jgi:predicted RecA/RadA family phage recombinase
MAFESIWNSGGIDVDIVAGDDIAAGEVVELGSVVIGIANRAIGTGQLGSITVGGVADLAKLTTPGNTFAAGAAVYWDASENNVATTDDSAANAVIGYAIQAAAQADTFVKVLMVRP